MNASGGMVRATNLLADRVGGAVNAAFELIGSVFLFLWRMIIRISKIPSNPGITVEYMAKIGITSIPLVILTSVFTGAVAAWQAAYQFSDFIPLSYLGTAVGKSIMIELGPVLTALVVAGRIGAAMAAEIGTMKVTEQLEAMECLSLDPFQFLFMPRLVAAVVMLPVLVIFSSFVGILGACGVSWAVFGLDPHIFFNGVKLFFITKDIMIGIFKAFIFGGVVATMGCYFGFYTTGGAQGVGEATKKSVVASSVWILVADYVIIGLFL